jgi:hypothetical protein
MPNKENPRKTQEHGNLQTALRAQGITQSGPDSFGMYTLVRQGVSRQFSREEGLAIVDGGSLTNPWTGKEVV